MVINLQTTLLTHLKLTWQAEESNINYRVLAEASDDSRVNSVLILCQLYQRMSQAARIQPSIAASSSLPTPPTSFSPQFSQRSAGSPAVAVAELVSAGVSPYTPATPPIVQETYFPPSNTSRSPHGERKLSSETNKGKGLFSRMSRNSSRNSAGSESVYSEVSEFPPSSRPDCIPELDDTSASYRFEGPDSVSLASEEERPYPQTPEDDLTINPWSAPTHYKTPSPKHRAVPYKVPSIPPHNTSILPVQRSATAGSTLLHLPNEDNKYLGFCKGAWKLQNNIKKAMQLNKRPAGIYSQISFWQCQKCSFQGPAKNTNSKKPTYDQRVRTSPNGIRYRWVFLAKSHITMKSPPDLTHNTGGETGSFGCIFCCLQTGELGVFGDVESFMKHLETHIPDTTGREDGEGIFSREVCFQTKAVVGRFASDTEEGWDINLVARGGSAAGGGGGGQMHFI